MSVINPIAFAFAFVIPIIIALYLLKLRRKNILVSSTFFWNEMTQDLQANVPFQKLRWNYLLFFQILAALGIIIAMADLRVFGSLNEGQKTIFIIDSSASMGSINGLSTRHESVKSKIRRYCANLALREEVMIIEAAEHARVALDFTSNVNAINKALESLKVHDTRADMQTAFTLAQNKASDASSPAIVVASDFCGVSPDIFADSQYQVNVLQAECSGRNAAITDFTISGVSKNENSSSINPFLIIRNYTDSPLNINVEFLVDGDLVDIRPVFVEAKERTSKIFKDVPYNPHDNSPGIVEARLDIDDALRVDNSAWAFPQLTDSMSVLLVGDNPFLKMLLSGIPGVRLYQISQNDYSANYDFDLTFFSNWAPEKITEGSYVFFAPPEREYLPCELSVQVDFPHMTDWDENHPLLRFVNPGSFNVYKASSLLPKAGSITLIESDSTPLMIYGENNRIRTVLFPFDLDESSTDLITKPTFPIIIYNILSFFRAYADSPVINLRTEGIGAINVPELTEKAILKYPDGTEYEIPVEAGHLFIDIDTTGVYHLTAKGGDSEFSKCILANFLDESESDISLATPPDVGEGNERVKQFNLMTEKKLWKWLLLFTLFILVIEWFFYHRKGF